MPIPSISELADLNLAELVAQMVVVRASGYLFDHQIQYPEWEPPAAKLRYWLEDLGVGGVILLGGSAGEIALRSQQLQNWAKIPLLIAADIEEGVGQRFSGATWFPPPMAISEIARKDLNKALHHAELMGAITAQEALAIGINWVLAPVVDVNNNPDNPVINVRAFGETPEQVSQLATAFIRGAKVYPVLTAAKHFPGHGDTATDSHLELPILPHSPDRLAEIELPPFQAAIAAGVDAVMSAHLLIKCWDDVPATLSKRILTEQLRQQLGFEGLIVTDALVMAAIAHRYGANQAPVMAVEAGVDILLMPVDPEGAIAAVCEAVNSGRISQERILASVKRIWKAKHKVSGEVEEQRSTLAGEHFSRGLGEQKSRGVGGVEARGLMLDIAQPTALASVTNILRETQQIYGSLPLRLENTESRRLRNLIVVDDLLACNFLNQHTPAIALPTQLGYTTQLSDLQTSATATYSDGNQPTLLQLFIRSKAFRDTASMTQAAQHWFKTLLSAGDLQALVVYGSPYVLERFLPALPPEVPCLFSYGQMPDAQAIAMANLFQL